MKSEQQLEETSMFAPERSFLEDSLVQSKPNTKGSFKDHIANCFGAVLPLNFPLALLPLSYSLVLTHCSLTAPFEVDLLPFPTRKYM